MEEILDSFDYSLPHIIHNNLCYLLKNRPYNPKTPHSFPYSITDKKDNVLEKNKFETIEEFSNIVSFNINIILNTAALTENSLEHLLVGPLDEKSDITQINSISIRILKEEIIKVSSLEKYFNFYEKIYNKKIKEILDKEELSCFKLLFNIRNLIIHCSIMSGQTKKNGSCIFLYVNDPFYINEILIPIKKLFNLDDSYYILPETIFSWNNLIDKILISVFTSIKKISQESKSIFPNITLPLEFYAKKDFEYLILNKTKKENI